jgi:hypothetical protein
MARAWRAPGFAFSKNSLDLLLDADRVRRNLIVNFPSLSAAVFEMEAAARAAAERRGIVAGQTRSTPNAFAQKTVDAWPSNVDSSRAVALGITCKSSLAEICDAFLGDYDSFWKQNGLTRHCRGS